MKYFVLALASYVLMAQSVLGDSKAETQETAKAPPAPQAKSTQHSVRIDGQTIRYTATAGWLILKNDKGEPHARFGYTAYLREDVPDSSQRPIMFAFNGGPGSSSVWLHMGILGPRRVRTVDTAFTPPPPYSYVNNEYSIVDATDLVMVDPVGTGFSKPLGETEGKAFWGVDQDIRSVGAFIKQFITQHGRWSSPKYILGESYGGVRSAGLVWHLQSRHAMHFNGVVLVSPFLNMGSGIDGANAEMPHVLFLSTLAATAWYHDLLTDKNPDLEAFVAEVDRFAYDEYAPALMKGYTIGETEKEAVAKKLATYTGTTQAYWLKANLRVSHQQFLQELGRHKRVVTGRIDSRFVGPAVNLLGETMDYDPFFPSVGPAYTAAFLDYLHNDLQFGRDENYVISAFGLDWDWSHQPPNGGPLLAVPWADLRPDLSMAMTTNPGLHILVQQGYYDVATPIAATKHDINHLSISAEARKRIRMAYYEAGHMMYVHEPSMKQFRADLVEFVRDTDRVE